MDVLGARALDLEISFLKLVLPLHLHCVSNHNWFHRIME